MIYLLISVFIFNIAAYVVPKQLTKQEIYTSALFSFSLGILLDVILALKYHLYGYFEGGVQLRSLIVTIGLFPAAGILFLNYYPRKESLLKQILYILIWTGFCLLYEWTSLISGFFYYNGWKMIYSVLTYPILLIFHIIHLSVFRFLKYKEHEKR